MGDMLKCSSCGAEMEAEQKFCAECGTRYITGDPAQPTHCPNPACGQTLKANGKVCPACGTVIDSAAQEATRNEQAQPTPNQAQRQLWYQANDYLIEDPDGDYASSAILIAEIAKTSMAIYHAMNSADDPIDYSLFDNNVNATNRSQWDILNNWGYEESPKTVEIPGKVPNLIYIAQSLDTKEFRDIVSRRLLGVQLDIADLEKRRNEILHILGYGTVVRLNAVEERIKEKYASYLMDGKTKAEVEKISGDELINEANIYYKAYEQGKLEKAQKGFERLASYDPFWQYLHEMLYNIYLQQKDYRRAVEEAMFSAYIDDFRMQEHTKAGSGDKYQNNIHAMNLKARTIYYLGLSPSLPIYLHNISDEFSKEEISSDDDKERAFNQMIYLKHIGQLVTIALANTEVVNEKIRQTIG